MGVCDPEKEKNHDTVMESWTDEDDNEYSSNVRLEYTGADSQLWAANLTHYIPSLEGSFENAASQRHKIQRWGDWVNT